jgi:hypothetical protein
MQTFIGVAFLCFGVFFFVMGIFGLVIATIFLLPETAPKAIALGVLVLFSAPVSTQAIARSAYRDGCMMVGLVRDDLSVQYVDYSYNYTIGDDVSDNDPEVRVLESDIEVSGAITDDEEAVYTS